MNRRIYIIGVAALLCSGSLQAQERHLLDSLHYRAELQATVPSGDHAPLWLNANKYGMSSLKTTNGFLRAALARPLSLDNGRKWGVGYGIDAAVAAGFTSTLVLQQAYVEGRWLKGVLTVGAKEQPMELKNPELSSGAQALGINARPVPSVRLSLPDYWAIPFTRGWLSLKGHIAYGKTTDGKWQKDFVSDNNRYTEGTLLHTKAGYLKIGPKNITLELGLEMASQFGGKSYYDINSDGQREVIENAAGLKAFWHAFVPGGSGADEVGSDYRNSEGNQLGSWVARLNIDQPSWYLGIYADHFFEDHSSMFMLDYNGYGQGQEWDTRKDRRYFLYDLKDIMLGAELKLKRIPWLNDIVVEYLYTKYQSGPVYHDHSPYISSHLGGRDDYYNHHIFTGWQHWGQVMGNPLYRSPLYNDNGSIRVTDNRFVAWHLGVSGQPLAPLHYRFLATYQTGLGTYADPLPGRHYNLSLLAEASWRFPHDWMVRGALAMDKGRLLGDNYGFQLSIIKTGILAK